MMETIWESKTQDVIKMIMDLKERYGIDDFQTIELFCADGQLLSGDLAKLSESFVGYEINPEKESEFRQNVPSGEFRCEDSIKMMSTIQDGGAGIYNLISVDASCCIYGENNCEHFEIINYIYKLVKSGKKAMCVFPVVREPYDIDKEENLKWMERRKEFYATQENNLDLDKVYGVYDKIFEKQGLDVVDRSYTCRGHRNGIDWLYEYVYILEKN